MRVFLLLNDKYRRSKCTHARAPVAHFDSYLAALGKFFCSLYRARIEAFITRGGGGGSAPPDKRRLINRQKPSAKLFDLRDLTLLLRKYRGSCCAAFNDD
jgi:hypothetical protein